MPLLMSKAFLQHQKSSSLSSITGMSMHNRYSKAMSVAMSHVTEVAPLTPAVGQRELTIVPWNTAQWSVATPHVTEVAPLRLGVSPRAPTIHLRRQLSEVSKKGNLSHFNGTRPSTHFPRDNVTFTYVTCDPS
jgi:hypothetical protein